jgi:alkanesulfonate monooxygenase SsuD/methylene tetrahydromethanopterin reductase-like flavin-dependent oxidoreductase (luciferase family)
MGDPSLELANQQACAVADTTAQAEESFSAIRNYCRQFAEDIPDFPGSVWETYRNDLLMLADNLEEAARRSLVGDPEAVTDRLRFYEELGVQHMILFMDCGPAQEQVLASMRTFAEKVMPRFKDS